MNRLHRPIVKSVFRLSLVVILMLSSHANAQCGNASWCALNSDTASGEHMNPNAFTAAHRNLGFGTKVRVTNRRNGRSAVVGINDRGPFIRGLIIDLSKADAAKLGYLNRGHAFVCISKF